MKSFCIGETVSNLDIISVWIWILSLTFGFLQGLIFSTPKKNQHWARETLSLADIRLCYYLTIGGCKETGAGSGYCSHKLGHKIRPGLWLVTAAKYWPLIGRDCGRNVWVNNAPSLSVNSLFWDELWAKIGVTAQLFTRQTSASHWSRLEILVFLLAETFGQNNSFIF